MPVISLLEDRARQGTADLEWIVFKLSRRNITAEMVKQITTAKSGISWVTLQAYVEQPEVVSIARIETLERKLRGLFGQLQVVEFLKSLDPNITLKTAGQVNTEEALADIIVIASRDVRVPKSFVFNPQDPRAERQVLTLRQGQRLAVKAKAWHTHSYSPRSVRQLCWEVRRIASRISTIVIFTGDFLSLRESKQQAVARGIKASGGRLVVLPETSAPTVAQNTARFLYDLSRGQHPQSSPEMAVCS